MSLEVGAGQCGWKKAGQKVRLELYVQYDAHVQQVVDEQIDVECDMDRGEGGIVLQAGGDQYSSIECSELWAGTELGKCGGRGTVGE